MRVEREPGRTVLAGARRGVACLAVALLGACAGPGRSAPPAMGPAAPLVVALDADRDGAAREVAERARGAEVVYLGELHDNPAIHVAQAAVLRAMVARGARPALAFEMVPEGDQAELTAAVRSAAPADEVGRRLRWAERGWPDFRMYWPLFELARRAELAVVAADLDPGLTRQVSRGGLRAVGDAAGRLASALPPDPALDRAIGRRFQAAHCNVLPAARIPAMVDSWFARNVTIARHLRDALEHAAQVVVIIGRGHQSPGGVPAQLSALRPGTRQLVVGFVETDDRGGPDLTDREDTRDVLWRVPGVDRPDPCRGLMHRLGRSQGMDGLLSGRIAIVTGAASGIGRAASTPVTEPSASTAGAGSAPGESRPWP